MANKTNIGECIYCGTRTKLTKDHIPPKNLFPKPRPHDLITVPSCLECNKGMEKDDEYFRLITVFREDAQEHIEAQRLLSTIERSFSGPEKEKLRYSLLNSLEYVDVITPAGIYTGTKPSFQQDYGRLNNVVNRIMKGLFYHEKGYRLPDSNTSEAWGDPFVPDPSDPERSERVVSFLVNQKRNIGNGVFIYWTYFDRKDLNTSAWLMLFFGRVPYLSYTLLKGHAVIRDKA